MGLLDCRGKGNPDGSMRQNAPSVFPSGEVWRGGVMGVDLGGPWLRASCRGWFQGTMAGAAGCGSVC